MCSWKIFHIERDYGFGFPCFLSVFLNGNEIRKTKTIVSFYVKDFPGTHCKLYVGARYYPGGRAKDNRVFTIFCVCEVIILEKVEMTTDGKPVRMG